MNIKEKLKKLADDSISYDAQVVLENAIEELESKDKVIELMSEALLEVPITDKDNGQVHKFYVSGCIKRHFENRIKEDK